MFKEPGDIIGEDKINDIVYRFFKDKDDISDDLQK